MSDDNKNIVLNDVSLAELLDLMGRNKPLFSEKDQGSEGELLKKAWFNHVLVTLEKLDASVDNLQNDVNNIKQQLFKDLVELREKIRSEMQTCQGNRARVLEKLEANISATLKDLTADNDKVIESMQKNLRVLEARVKTQETKSLVTSTKLGVYVAIASLCGGGFLQLIIVLAKHFLTP